MAQISGENPTLYHKVLRAALDLKENGWAVIDDILSVAECKAYLSSCWDWLESLGTGGTITICHLPIALSAWGLLQSPARILSVNS